MLFIFGGTFDPVHYGHLRLAENLYNLSPKSEVRLMPSAQPPHRECPGASAKQRLEMLQLAIEGKQHLSLDDRELLREGPSYTLLSIEEIRAENPAEP